MFFSFNTAVYAVAKVNPVIQEIRNEKDRTDKERLTVRKEEVDDGAIGEVSYYYKGNVLKKIVSYFYFETGNEYREYYIKNEKGEYSIIGNGDKENTTITVDGIEFNVKNENIVKGDKLGEVTQKECAKNIIRNEVEDSFGDGRQVTRSIRNNRL